MTAPPVTASTATAAPARGHLRTLSVLFFVSGFAALVYQVLWVRELGLLFGSTAQAAALTIAIFFTGIASGGWFWGRRAGQRPNSLRTFGLVELGVAGTALGHFVLIDVYHAVYPAIFGVVGASPALDTLTKAVIAATVLLPSSFLMGGTLPLMGQHLIRTRDRLGTTGTRLYAINTAGSATGALAAGFVLPLALGFQNAYLLAVFLDAGVGLAAIALARREPAAAAAEVPPTPQRATPDPRIAVADLPSSTIWVVAFASGFATLGVEVIWTRLFAQVLQNSVYTYALVLTTFLIALSLGAAVANLLCRVRRVTPETVLAVLLVLSAIAAATSPWLFHLVTDGLAYVGSDLGWNSYILAVGGVALIVMLIPGTALGAVLPFLLRTLQADERAPGEAMGRLIAANTSGAILGSLAAGFVLLPLVGAGRGLLLLAAIYPALLVGIALSRAPRSLPAAGLAAAAGVALIAVDPQGLVTVRTGLPAVEQVLEMREGPQANVAVTERDNNRRIRVNSFYTLGGTGAMHAERDQSVIPLLTHPDPREIFYLGMGTGITAGASMAFDDIERVEVCELIGDVVSVAEAHFDRWTGGLFDDDRATIIAEDGRTCLRRSPDRYDVIISDLFTPWKAGTGNLYTLEHYEASRERLHEGGTYVQWIPLYQVSERELAIIANTMDQAFDEVLLWRGDLFASRSIVALVGHQGPAIVDPGILAPAGRALLDDPERGDDFYEAMLLRMYAGNVTRSGRFAAAPINTDDMPLVEYLAPRTHRDVRIGEARFVTGSERERLYDDLLAAVPLAEDPALVLLSNEQRGYVHAGRRYAAYRWHDSRGRDEIADPAFEDFLDWSPPGSTRALSPSRVLLPPPRPATPAAASASH